MRLRIPSAEARPNGAGVSSSGLVERADGSGETCLGHVAEAAGLILLHRQRTIVEDELSEKCNLLEAIQFGGLCFSKRFRLNAVDLRFDGPDLRLGGSGNASLSAGVVAVRGRKCRCGREQKDCSRTRHTRVLSS